MVIPSSSQLASKLNGGPIDYSFAITGTATDDTDPATFLYTPAVSYDAVAASVGDSATATCESHI